MMSSGSTIMGDEFERMSGSGVRVKQLYFVWRDIEELRGILEYQG